MKKISLKLIALSALLTFTSISYADIDFTRNKNQDEIIKEKDYVHKKLKQYITCQGCVGIDKLSINSVDAKNSILKLTFDVTSSKNTLLNFNIPRNLTVVKAFLNNSENKFLSYSKFENMYTTIVPKGKSVLELNVILNGQSILLEDNFAYSALDIGKEFKTSKTDRGIVIEYVNSSSSNDMAENSNVENKNGTFVLNETPATFVQRELYLGKDWKMNTKLEIVNKKPSFINNEKSFELPLLPSEQIVTKTNFLVKDNVAKVDLSKSVEWTSNINPMNFIEFKPMKDVYQVIVINEGGNWSFDAEGSGAEPQNITNLNGKKVFFLMPEDDLKLIFSTPELNKGYETVINKALFKVSLNQTFDVNASFKVNSSVGGVLEINRNDDTSKIKSILVNNNKMFFNENDKNIKVVLNQGENNIEIKTSKSNINVKETVPSWTYNVPVYNYLVDSKSGMENRWVFWLSGENIQSPSVILVPYLILILALNALLVKFKLVTNPSEIMLLSIGFLSVNVFWLVLFFILYVIKLNYLNIKPNKETKVPVFLNILMILVLLGVMIKGFLINVPNFIIGPNESAIWFADTYNNSKAIIYSFPEYVFKGFIIIWSLIVASFVVNVVKDFIKNR